MELIANTTLNKRIFCDLFQTKLRQQHHLSEVLTPISPCALNATESTLRGMRHN